MLSIYKGHHCQHRSDDWPVLSAIVTPHRPSVVIELGTDEGGMAGWFADLVAPWGGFVHTFDIKRKFKESLLSDFPNLRYHEADVLDENGDGCRSITQLIVGSRSFSQEPLDRRVLLYCDNGNKPREVELYAEFLHVGSILGVHDYNTEIMADWVEPHVAALGYTPLGHAQMEALRNEWYTEPMTRFWLRTSAG